MNAKKEQKVRKQIDEILNAKAIVGGEEISFDFEILVTEWDNDTISFDGLVYEIMNQYHGEALFSKIDRIFTKWARSIMTDKDAYYDFIDYSNIMAVV